MEKHFYLGANTPYGFYSYYDSLIDQRSANKIYCIKGGPGTGKSTLMKSVASEMLHRGFDVEMIHCSSDDDSLDAILIKKLDVAFVDGTAPHIVDPKNPGAVDTVINLCNYWNEDGIRQNKLKIIDCGERIKRCFERAYNYLGAARKLYDDTETELFKMYDEYAKESFFESVIYNELSRMPISYKAGSKRKLFASGITPSGVISRLDTIFEGYKTYILKGYTYDILLKTASYAALRGLDVEMYFCPLNPEKKCEHLLIPSLNIAFTTSNKYHSYEKGETYEFEIDKKSPQKSCDIVKVNSELSDKLINMAIENIKEAKSIHDELEGYYIPNMDFSKIDNVKSKIIRQLLEII